LNVIGCWGNFRTSGFHPTTTVENTSGDSQNRLLRPTLFGVVTFEVQFKVLHGFSF